MPGLREERVPGLRGLPRKGCLLQAAVHNEYALIENVHAQKCVEIWIGVDHFNETVIREFPVERGRPCDERAKKKIAVINIDWHVATSRSRYALSQHL